MGKSSFGRDTFELTSVDEFEIKEVKIKDVDGENTLQ